ncbi:ribonuclease R [Metamycoplasma buccale]|uniref:ribonuclease R n=1 Tax=Metamycoplasma buccale TaxID=55602 RepID=UPI00398F6DEA
MKNFKNKESLKFSDEEVLDFIKYKKTVSFLTIAKYLKISPNQNKHLTNILNNLIAKKEIERLKNNDYVKINLITETEAPISITSKRLGFIDFINPINGEKNSAFLPPFQLYGVLDKDLLKVSIFSYEDNEKRTLYKANIIQNLEHSMKSIVGFIEFINNKPIFKAFDDKNKAKFCFINISNIPNKIKQTDLVKCSILKPNYDNVVILFDEIISNINEKDYVIKKIIANNDVNPIFADKILQEATIIPQEVSDTEITKRKDLRNLLTVTIDGLDTKDFDDAISCYTLPNGNYKLFIHIADVSYYVKENSEIDKEALQRGTSIYLPGKVIPMLPFELSNGICSLNPNAIRCCITLELEIDKNGNNISENIYPSVICSDYRLTYNEVNDYFDNKITIPTNISSLLDNAKSLSKILRTKKIDEGYVDFEIEESKVLMNNDEVVNIVIQKDGESEKLIEDFMVRANETVASLMLSKKLPSIYRIHEQPDFDKLLALQNLINYVGLKNINVPFDGNPKSFSSMIEKIKQYKFDDYIKMFLLRTMKKAFYSVENIGHFGLASKAYSHFTSPIRRYPDLLIHRLIRKYLFEHNVDETKFDEERKNIEKIAMLNSESEKIAMTVERDIVDVRKSQFFEKFINKKFEATLVSLEKFGAFFNIEEYQTSTLVRFEDMNSDIVKISDFIAKGKNIELKVGNKYQILIDSIDKEKGNINAKLV